MDIKDGYLCLTTDESRVSGVESPILIDEFNNSLEGRQARVNASIGAAQEVLDSDHNEFGMHERNEAMSKLPRLEAQKQMLEDIAAFVLVQEVTVI